MKLPPKKFVAMPWAFNLVNMIIHERLKVVISMSSRVKTLCSLSTSQPKEHDSVDSVGTLGTIDAKKGIAQGR